MKHIPILKFGEAKTLKVLDLSSKEQAEKEDLKEGEVLIEVHFSGINFADIIMRLGFYSDAPPKPFTPGYEVSGIVSKVGNKVTKVRPGDRVYAGTFFGGYSDYVKVPDWQAIPLPSHLSLEQGACLPVAFITSYHFLFSMARVRMGDKIMIDCATGGVGTMALLLLKNEKIDVVGLTSSPSKKKYVEELGARAMTHAEFFQSKEKDFDFILNSQGGKTIRQHFNLLAPNGRIVCLGISGGINDGKRDILSILKTVVTMPRFSVIELFNHNKGVFALNALHLMKNEEWIKKRMKDFDLIESKKISPHVGAIFKAEEVEQAHRAIENKKITGKVLLQWR